MTHFIDFVIIDDDEINNIVCRKAIEKTYPDARITDFTDPMEGFTHIVGKYANGEDNPITILLLDINMPVMTAWDFLELFDALDDCIKSQVKIHILSSSVNKDDMLRAQSNRNVEYYLIKPLTRESIGLIVHVMNKRLGIQI